MPDILIRGMEMPSMEQAYKTLIISYDGKVYEGVHPQPTAKKKEPIAEAVELPLHGDLHIKDGEIVEQQTIDRIDSNGNYEPSNCRWATAKEQANNRRNTVYVTIDGITKTLSGWAEFSGINRATINSRYIRGVRGVMLLHRTVDTKFKVGYNRYGDSRHYEDYAPVVVPAERRKSGE